MKSATRKHSPKKVEHSLAAKDKRNVVNKENIASRTGDKASPATESTNRLRSRAPKPTLGAGEGVAAVAAGEGVAAVAAEGSGGAGALLTASLRNVSEKICDMLEDVPNSVIFSLPNVDGAELSDLITKRSVQRI